MNIVQFQQLLQDSKWSHFTTYRSSDSKCNITRPKKRICINRLSSLFDSNGKRVFDEIEEREDSIFVTLTYSDEITESEFFTLDNVKINLFKYVVFVALKNGKHDPKSYTFSTEKVATEFNHIKTNHISAIYSVIDGYLI